MSFIGDIIGGIGSIEEGADLGQAEKLEKENVSLEKQITGVNVSQTQRQIFQGLGAEQADTGGAGLKMMGSGRALLQSSAYQGALQLQAIKTQGIIQENTYAAEAQADAGQSEAEIASGVGKIASSIFSMASMGE